MNFFCVLFICSFGVSNSIHGGTFLAMAGKDAVVFASDSRFSSQQTGPFMIGQYPRKVFRIGMKTIVGCFGLDSDAISLMDYMRDSLSEICATHISPQSISRVISDRLYSIQSMCSPIVAGMSDETPYICCMDSLGAQTETSEFAVVGTASSGLYAICEAFYRPNLPAAEVVKIAEKCLKVALERDVLSGCNVRIFTITEKGIFAKDFSTSDV